MATAHILAKLINDNVTSIIQKNIYKNSETYHVRLGKFYEKSAKAICEILKKQGHSCVVVKENNESKIHDMNSK